MYFFYIKQIGQCGISTQKAAHQPLSGSQILSGESHENIKMW